MVATLVWALAAFGGAYPWTLVPVVLLTIALWAIVRPRLFERDAWLDGALLCGLAAAAFQAVPLGASLRNALSPNADRLWASMQIGAARLDGPRALSLDPDATLTWLPAAAAAVALFFIARGLFEAGDVRWTTRAIAWTGLVVSPLAIVQAFSAPGLLYWTLRPVDSGGAVFGPFVNRNHMATWLLLALPMVIGYVVARGAARAREREHRAAIVNALEDPKTLWLIASAAAMFAALISSRSRAGLIGMIAAGVAGIALPYAAGRRIQRRWIVAVVAPAVVVAAALANTGSLLARFSEGAQTFGSRVEIWKTTEGMIRDFPVTGVGAGAYQTAMLSYQRQQQYGFFFNQAHNQYLQFAAEGGLLTGVPIAVAVMAFIAIAGRRLRADASPLFWSRVGALAAIAGVAVQSIWETGLRMPANALLCAVVAAIAVHDRF